MRILRFSKIKEAFQAYPARKWWNCSLNLYLSVPELVLLTHLPLRERAEEPRRSEGEGTAENESCILPVVTTEKLAQADILGS